MSRLPNRLFAVLLWLPILLRPFHTFFEVPSWLNAVSTSMILGVAVVVVIRSGRVPSETGSRILFAGLVVAILLFEISNTSSDGAGDNLEWFALVGIPAIMILPLVNDFQEFLQWFASLGLVTGLIYILDPFNAYQISGSYMTYGYQVLLPATAGILGKR